MQTLERIAKRNGAGREDTKPKVGILTLDDPQFNSAIKDLLLEALYSELRAEGDTPAPD